MKYFFALYGALWLAATVFLIQSETPVATTFEGLVFLFWLVGVFPVAQLAIAHFENNRPQRRLRVNAME